MVRDSSTCSPSFSSSEPIPWVTSATLWLMLWLLLFIMLIPPFLEMRSIDAAQQPRTTMIADPNVARLLEEPSRLVLSVCAICLVARSHFHFQ